MNPLYEDLFNNSRHQKTLKDMTDKEICEYLGVSMDVTNEQLQAIAHGGMK